MFSNSGRKGLEIRRISWDSMPQCQSLSLINTPQTPRSQIIESVPFSLIWGGFMNVYDLDISGYERNPCWLSPRSLQAGLDQQIPTRGLFFGRNHGEPRGQFPLQNHLFGVWLTLTHRVVSSSRIIQSYGLLCFFGCCRICWTWMNMANFLWAICVWKDQMDQFFMTCIGSGKFR